MPMRVKRPSLRAGREAGLKSGETWATASDAGRSPGRTPVDEVAPCTLGGRRRGFAGCLLTSTGRWIVNLIDRQIEAHSDPHPDGYATRTCRSGEHGPVVLDRTVVCQIAIDDILP